MRYLQTFIVLAGFLPSLGWIGSAGAQTTRPAATQTLAQAERVAVDLKHGMTAEDVQKLLGKPRRTTLKTGSNSAAAPSHGTLQWTYTWTGSSSPATLHVDFVAKTPDQWYVNSWEWAAY